MNSQKNYYMVRPSGNSDECFNILVKESVVAVGWRDVNFSSGTASDIWGNVQEKYFQQNRQIAPIALGKHRNQIERFLKIKKGDYILVPYPRRVFLAEAKGEFFYQEKGSAWNFDLANQHKVEYLKENNKEVKVPRDNLSEELQRRLRVPGNIVADLYEFKDEIESLFRDPKSSYVSKIEEERERQEDAFKKALLKNIQKGSTGLKAGGIGLEELVAELFKCEGYQANVLAKKTFSGLGDADVEAIKEDIVFKEIKILAQIKHHKGYSRKEGIRQLNDIMESGEYSEYLFMFITSAKVDEDVLKEAENLDIRVIDGQELTKWIYDNLGKLDDNIKLKLGIIDIPYLVH